MSRASSALPIGLGLAGVALVAVGLSQWWSARAPRPAGGSPGGAPAGAPAPGPTPPPAGLATPGAGTFTHPAPADRSAADAAAACPGCDVVLITMCSLRRDHVGAYGLAPGKGRTPTLDALAAEGWRFDNSWSASTFTLAGLTAVLTGRFGSATGVTGWDKGLVADIPTLPEVLGIYGYETAAFTMDAPSGFRPDYGLDRGFQTMTINMPTRDTPDGRHGPGAVGPGGGSVGPALQFLAGRADPRPLFLMFHSRTAHFPFVLEDDLSEPTGVHHALYEAGRDRAGENLPGNAGGTKQQGVVPVAKDEVQELTRAQGEAGLAVWWRTYADSVERADHDLKLLLDGIKAKGRWDQTVVIVVADHGESLGDHGELLHGDAYWDSVVHVPLLMRVPGLGAGVSPALLSQVDILPTVLDLVGAMAPAGVDGASALPILRGTAAEIRAATLIEGGVARAQSTTPRGAIIQPPWALLRQDMGCGPGQPAGHRPPGEPFTCLYDLAADPGQTRNLALERPEVIAALSAGWEAYRAKHGKEGAQLQLDPTLVDALRRTGYDFRSAPGAQP
jgi:arylsulfatase A-like enzyme